MKRAPCGSFLALAALAATSAFGAFTPVDAPDRRLYVVGTSHLDTQWRWTIRETIDEYIPATLHDNFALFEKYPGYVFSFEGAFRYMLMQEYYPEEFDRLRGYVRDGRWRVAGSWVDAVDTNIPSPESLIRHALYGNGYFKREFGARSRDVFLPDCFGFGYALPSVAAHCGITGFSTQKLTWGSAAGVPFDIGLWEGVDGSTLVAALNPGAYVSRIEGDLSADSAVVADVEKQGAASGVYAAMRYFGTGDTGGAPTDGSVAWLEKSMRGDGPVRVMSVASDQLARDLTAMPAAARARLPRYRGELLMTDHGAGCYTSQAAMKWWNRKNEKLADAAERASVAAAWLGGLEYPKEELTEAWIRFLWHQFHDDLTGTSIPEAYAFSWNDEAIALNRFASVLEAAVGSVASGLDTRVKGTPIVLYNPAGTERIDLAEAIVDLDGSSTLAARVLDPDGVEVPCQIRRIDASRAQVRFVAQVPSVGFAVYDLRLSGAPCGIATGVRVRADGIENNRYRVDLNAAGDISRIYDKAAARELLSAPATLQLIDDEPYDWAAWEIDYDDLMSPPRAVAGSPARVRVLESGPAAAALEIVREAEGSTFRQVVRLAAGSDRVEIENEIDWRTPGTLLKAAFPLAARSDSAVYDLGVGTIHRSVNTKKLYEVPAQQWAAIDDRQDGYRVAVLNDSRHGWDMPDDHTLRLTLAHTPRVNDRWKWVEDQKSNDLGTHRVTIAICGAPRGAGHPATSWEAERLNQPIRAFQSSRHDGPLGRSFSLARVGFEATPEAPHAWGRSARTVFPGNPGIAIRAVKLSEAGDAIIVRLQNLTDARVGGARIAFARGIERAWEVNGMEEPIGACALSGGAVVSCLEAYEPRSFAVRLADPPATLARPRARPIPLPYDLAGITDHGTPGEADFDGAGRTLPGELLPSRLVCGGIPFETGPRGAGEANVLTCRAQEIPIPEGFASIELIAASVGGDRGADFTIDGRRHRLWIQDWAEPIAQWDDRLAGGELRHEPDRIAPAYTKPAPIAWVGTHTHEADGGREAYAFAHFCRYRIDLPPGARRLRLPEDGRIRVLAATAIAGPREGLRVASPLIEIPKRSMVKIGAARREFLEETRVALSSPNPGAEIRYTLDGTAPSGASALYDGPITIRETTTLKARAIAPDMDDSFVAWEAFTRLTPRPAIEASAVRPGLLCRSFEGEWRKLPDFGTLEPKRSEVVESVAIPPSARPEYYALDFTGFVRMPEDGLYEFHLASDDGSALLLDGEVVIDNDGLHGRTERSATVALQAGHHAIEVRMFQAPGDAALDLEIEGPGLERQPIPAAWLFHNAR